MSDQIYGGPPLATNNTVSPWQILSGNAFIDTTGSGSTTTEAWDAKIQPFVVVTFTEYIVVISGLTLIESEVPPSLHR
jgi:hypothetical protein